MKTMSVAVEDPNYSELNQTKTEFWERQSVGKFFSYTCTNFTMLTCQKVTRLRQSVPTSDRSNFAVGHLQHYWFSITFTQSFFQRDSPCALCKTSMALGSYAPLGRNTPSPSGSGRTPAVQCHTGTGIAARCGTLRFCLPISSLSWVHQ